MPPADFKRKWIKLWVDECLTGTIREDLTPEERSVWYDFLLLSGRNRPPGCISANENTPISLKRLAAILNIPESLIKGSIKKFKATGRVTTDEKGVIHIANWEKYQYTDYDRQKPYRKKKSLDQVNQEYLAKHPKQVSGSVEMEGYDPEDDDEPLVRGGDSLEEHEEALMKQNPHVRKFKESQDPP